MFAEIRPNFGVYRTSAELRRLPNFGPSLVMTDNNIPLSAFELTAPDGHAYWTYRLHTLLATGHLLSRKMIMRYPLICPGVHLSGSFFFRDL